MPLIVTKGDTSEGGRESPGTMRTIVVDHPSHEGVIGRPPTSQSVALPLCEAMSYFSLVPLSSST